MDLINATTAKSNWLSVRTAEQKSGGEIIDLPLTSAYNQAFLETITEEGSEFEASEDGSASWGNSVADSYNADLFSNTLVQQRHSLELDERMIGELDCPVDCIDSCDISISVEGPLGTNRKLEHNNPEQPTSECYECEQTTPQIREVADKKVLYEASRRICTPCSVTDLMRTPDYQNYDEVDFKQMQNNLLQRGTTQKTKGLLGNSSSLWTEPDNEEDVLVLATDDDTNRLCWKLESMDSAAKERRLEYSKVGECLFPRGFPTGTVSAEQNIKLPNWQPRSSGSKSHIEYPPRHTSANPRREGQVNIPLLRNLAPNIRYNEHSQWPEKERVILYPSGSHHQTTSTNINNSMTNSTPIEAREKQPGCQELWWQPQQYKPFYPQCRTVNRHTQNHSRNWSTDPCFPVIQPCSQRFHPMFQDSSFLSRPPPLPKSMTTGHVLPCFPTTNPVLPCDRNNISPNPLNSSHMFNQFPSVGLVAEKQHTSFPQAEWGNSTALRLPLSANGTGRLVERRVTNDTQLEGENANKNVYGFDCRRQHANGGLDKIELSDQYYSGVEIKPVNKINTELASAIKMVHPSYCVSDGLYKNLQLAGTERIGLPRNEMIAQYSTPSVTKSRMIAQPDCVHASVVGVTKAVNQRGSSGSEPQTPMWVANSTPRSQLSANSSEQYEPLQNTVSNEDSDGNNGLSNPSKFLKPNSSNMLRPLQRSPAVLGVSELLSKTDEELHEFMQDVHFTKDQDRSSPQWSETTQNQTTSIPTDHSPARRRFPYISNPNSKPKCLETLDTDSASDQLERRSFYDYGCDEEDEEIDDDLENVFEQSEGEILNRPTTRRQQSVRQANHKVLQDRTHLYNMSYETASSILDDILKLDMNNSQYMWSDTCHSPNKPNQTTEFATFTNHTQEKDIFEPWDLPYIDSDVFAGEPWTVNSRHTAQTFLHKPRKASLDEITLTSKQSSCRNSWGSASDLNQFAVEADGTHGRSNRSRAKRVRIRSRRDFHSYDSSADIKSVSRLRKLTVPWLQRLCGCVGSSRFRKKDLH